MREIKYKAWYNNKMWDVQSLEWLEGDDHPAKAYLFGLDGWVIVADKYMPLDSVGVAFLVEFTGLHDKRGTPIYEADIVLGTSRFYTEEVKGVVEYVSLAFAFVGKTESGKKWFDTITNPKITRAYVEVIGNRFESPELLEKGE